MCAVLLPMHAFFFFFFHFGDGSCTFRFLLDLLWYDLIVDGGLNVKTKSRLFQGVIFLSQYGVKIAQWQSARLVIKRSWVQVMAEVAGEFSSPGSTSYADSYFGICSTPA